MLLRDRHRLVDIDVRQHDDELFAAVTRARVVGALAAIQSLRDGLQHFVAGVVPVFVVHELEVIDVDEEQRKRLLAPARSSCVHRRCGGSEYW